MSYRRKAKQSYSAPRRRHLPYLNVSFRSTWDRGLDEALAQIEKLRNEGWNIDYERGALTQSQADAFAGHVEKYGFETARIPVAKWGEDLVQFVAYKPKQQTEPGEVVPPPVPQPKRKEPEEFDPVERFQKTFWTRGKPDDPDRGTLMSPDRDMAVVRHDADPTHSLTKMATDVVSKASVREPLDYGKLLKAEKAGRDKVKFGRDGFFSIDKVKRATRIIGRSEAYFDTSAPLAIRSQRGDVVLIAPLTGASDIDSIDIKELNKL